MTMTPTKRSSSTDLPDKRHISWNHNVQTFQPSIDNTAVQEEVFDVAALDKEFLDAGAYSYDDFKRGQRDKLLSKSTTAQRDKIIMIAVASVAASDVVNQDSCSSLDVGDLISSKFLMLKYKQASYQSQGENAETEIKSNDNSKTEDGAWDCSGTFEYYHDESEDRPPKHTPTAMKRLSSGSLRTLHPLREISESTTSHAPLDFEAFGNASEGSLDIDFSQLQFSGNYTAKKAETSKEAFGHSNNTSMEMDLSGLVFFSGNYLSKMTECVQSTKNTKHNERDEGSISTLTGCDIHLPRRDDARAGNKKQVMEDSLSTLGSERKGTATGDSSSSLMAVIDCLPNRGWERKATAKSPFSTLQDHAVSNSKVKGLGITPMAHESTLAVDMSCFQRSGANPSLISKEVLSNRKKNTRRGGDPSGIGPDEHVMPENDHTPRMLEQRQKKYSQIKDGKDCDGNRRTSVKMGVCRALSQDSKKKTKAPKHYVNRRSTMEEERMSSTHEHSTNRRATIEVGGRSPAEKKDNTALPRRNRGAEKAAILIAKLRSKGLAQRRISVTDPTVTSSFSRENAIKGLQAEPSDSCANSAMAEGTRLTPQQRIERYAKKDVVNSVRGHVNLRG